MSAPLRCKVGDMVVLVQSTMKNTGAFGTAISLQGSAPAEYAGRLWHEVGEGALWLVKWAHPVDVSAGEKLQETLVPDSWLQPIRGIPEGLTKTTSRPRELVKEEA